MLSSLWHKWTDIEKLLDKISLLIYIDIYGRIVLTKELLLKTHFYICLTHIDIGINCDKA